MNEETTVQPVETPGELEEKKVARWEDCIDIFFAPRQLFERRAEDRIGPPLITLLIIALVVHFAMTPINAMVVRVTMADSPEAMEAMESFGALMQVFGAITVPIRYLLSIAAGALVLWLIGKPFDVRATYARMFLIATFAAFVTPVSDLVSGFLMYFHGEAGLDIVRHGSVGLLRFVGSIEMPPARIALFSRVDLFAIWQAALWGVGLAVVYGVDRKRAAAVAAITWALFALPGIVGGLVSAGMG